MNLTTPRFETLKEKKLVGKKITMSFSTDRTFELWRSFMPLKSTIRESVGSVLYSVKVYSSGFFARPDPEKMFDKWAAVEVSSFDSIPEGMLTLVIPEGLYAVFHYTGNPDEGENVFRYLFTEWLPSSGYRLDDRPHFEVLDERFRRNDPSSQEEIWIPVTQL
jgi:AraC family transcriptional regulator